MINQPKQVDILKVAREHVGVNSGMGVDEKEGVRGLPNDATTVIEESNKGEMEREEARDLSKNASEGGHLATDFIALLYRRLPLYPGGFPAPFPNLLPFFQSSPQQQGGPTVHRF